MRNARRLAAFAAIGLFVNLVGVGTVSAQNATWVGGTSGDFDTASNWNPNTAVPTGTASFGTSARTAVTFSAGTTNVGGWTFNAGASAYSFDVGSTLTFTGAGIVINGGGASITNDLGGFLSFNNTSTAGSASITNDSPMFFNNSSTAGSATIANNAALSFNDSSTAGSATFTNNRFLTFNNSSTAGGAGIANTDNSFLTFNNSSTAGGASITTTGVSTLNFNDTSTAGGASITISGVSTLSFNNTSTAGSASITNNGGVVNFNDSSTAGNASITNNGALSFNNTSTAGNARISNNSGTLLNFNNSSTGGSAIILNNAGGATLFQDTSTASNATITNVVGGLTKFFTGSTAGNAVINNNGGVTQFDNSSTAGSAIITTNSGGSVFFVNTSSGGQASFITNTGGVFDMSGLTSGGMSAGSIAGAGNYFLGPNMLTVGSNNLSTTVSGVITSSGTPLESLAKTGTGTLALTGINTFTGATLVNGGTLEVDGSITASRAVTVEATGTLSGTGEVRRVAIETGGALAPGNVANPTGTLTIMTNLAFQSGTFYLVQVGASASNTSIVGTASVANATVRFAVTGGAQGMKNYDIVHSTVGLGGTTFSGIQSLTAGFTETLSYTTTDVFLSLTAQLGSGGGLNANQQAIANNINSVFNSGGTLPTGFVNLFNPSRTALANALTQVSGETATGSQQTTFDAMGLFMGLLTDPFMNRGGGINSSAWPTGYAEEDGEASAYAGRQKTDAFAMFTKAPLAKVYDPRWSVWAAGFGGSQSTSGNAAFGSNDTTSRIAGTAVGADYLFSPNTIAGFAFAGGSTNFSVANGGTGRSDLFQMGAYVRHNEGPAYISVALAYGWQDITTNRTVTVAGIDQLRAEFNANALSGRVEGGYRFVSPATFGIGITPYAAAQFVTFDLPAYAEQTIVGLNTFALSYGARNVTDPRAELGIRADKSFALIEGILTLRGRFAWAHDYDPDRSIAATFQSLPGASFVVNGAAQASDSALTTASVEMKWKNGWSAAATFEGEFSGVTASYAGKGVVRYAW